MFAAVISLMEGALIKTFFILITLCWLCEERKSVAVGVGNMIVVIRDTWKVMVKDMYTTFKNEDPVVEEPDLVVSSSDQSDDQTSGSMTADFVSPSFPLYHFPFPQGEENIAQELEQVMRNIMQVVDLTIKRVLPVENSLSYLQFIFFDLNLGKEMFEYVDFHILDQLDWWHYRIGDSELEIVGKLYGGLIVQGMRLDFPDFWKPMIRKVLNHLENNDIQFVNFAQSAFNQLKKDLPQEYHI
ncbi:Hypothetical protein CINCED_3A016483 [Cinara cedri]|nr:Hypothetical protein CINCED_3A016483 [Cinara cedri]